MYFEEAEVKEYKRKNGTKYKQLHLGTGSKFEKKEKVAVINLDDLKDLIVKANPEYVEELLATNESLTSEKEKLEHDLQEIKKESEENESKLKVAKDNILNLQEEKEELTSDLLAEKDKLIKEKDFSKKLLAVINVKDKDIVYLATRGLGSRMINKLTDRIKAVVEASDVETNVNSTSEE